jgi:lysozyme family protein
MASFKEAFAETSAVEGRYVVHHDDRRGETYRGIARRFHPAWPGWARIDAARDDPDFPSVLAGDETLAGMVADFYKQNFWNRLRGNQIPDQAVAMELFDTAVYIGVGRAARILQESLNLLNRNGRSYEEIGVDGLVGKVTLGALDELLKTEGSAAHLLALMNLLEGMHYVDLVRGDATQRAFVRDWLARVEI